jgi:hypothetical protein
MVISDRQLHRAMYGYGDIGAEDIFGVIKGGIQLGSQIAGAVQAGNAGAKSPAVYPAGPNVQPWGQAPYAPYQPPQRDNTLLYVIGGVAVLGIAGFLLLKK